MSPCAAIPKRSRRCCEHPRAVLFYTFLFISARRWNLICAHFQLQHFWCCIPEGNIHRVHFQVLQRPTLRSPYQARLHWDGKIYQYGNRHVPTCRFCVFFGQNSPYSRVTGPEYLIEQCVKFPKYQVGYRSHSSSSKQRLQLLHQLHFLSLLFFFSQLTPLYLQTADRGELWRER